MDLDLTDREAIHSPASYFARAREKSGDVQWSDHHRAWVLLSHAEVEAAFRESEVLSADRSGSFARVARSRGEAFQVVVDLLTNWMNFRDPPVHTRLREPVRTVFTPRAVAKLESDIQEIVDSVLDGFDGDAVDLGAAFARSIPALVIAAILGVDAADRGRFQGWSDDIAKMVFSMEPGSADDAPVVAAASEFWAFFGRLVERERVHPTGTLLTAIVQHRNSDLTEAELIGLCTLILFGGHETTTTLLTSSLALLLEQPERMQWLRENPDGYATAIEEFMRVGGPARTMPRKIASTHERGGRTLEAGQNAFLCIAAANHDEDVFTDPGTVDLTRDPNPQLGFGWGVHFCLGANLARLEATVALRTLLDRFPRIRAAGPIPEVRASAMGFGRRPIHVSLGK
ncbi:MAG: cytochrome P450 [Dehalococcoidia bacterium]|nr:cytochrome P450 [Dehalococcoidia bacterium]MCB9484729.1 cytochrome P450 [Thermoflexaceae bacterium]